MDAIGVAAVLGPGAVAGGLGDPDEQEGEPAQDYVGADPFFLGWQAGFRSMPS
jgi:hypothetical protein